MPPILPPPNGVIALQHSHPNFLRMDSFSLPSFYLSAPTSPAGCSPQNVQFYSTRSSPFHQETSADDEFDFGTTQQEDQEHDNYNRLPARANSFSAMAFADELFCNGQVLPLKLPPRLQRSVPTSPRSRSSRIKNPFPFVQQCTWNDDFDPFTNALDKVTSGRMSVHRRSPSYSPFSAPTVNWDQERPQHTKPGRDLEAKEPIRTEIMMERKGSMYSRWVRSQTMTKNQTPTAPTMIKRLGRRVRDANYLSNKETVKSMKKPSEPTSCTESKMQKVKSVLLRYASLKKETNQQREIVTISKISYFKRFSLSFKTNLRKKELIESNMAAQKHDTKPLPCFCYAPRIPMMKQALRIS